ncbi:MAG: hypothetical protein AB2693_32420 [Candidatus Thiodiazotropha sp.]
MPKLCSLILCSYVVGIKHENEFHSAKPGKGREEWVGGGAFSFIIVAIEGAFIARFSDQAHQQSENV